MLEYSGILDIVELSTTACPCCAYTVGRCVTIVSMSTRKGVLIVLNNESRAVVITVASLEMFVTYKAMHSQSHHISYARLVAVRLVVQTALTCPYCLSSRCHCLSTGVLRTGLKRANRSKTSA
eukprot:7049-Heterococcus_DN1.PRE.1